MLDFGIYTHSYYIVMIDSVDKLNSYFLKFLYSPDVCSLNVQSKFRK